MYMCVSSIEVATLVSTIYYFPIKMYIIELAWQCQCLFFILLQRNTLSLYGHV
jgi:hypothetical protein